MPHTVADPDLQIRGGGEVIQTPEIFRSATATERGVFATAMIYHVGNYSAKNFRSDLTDLCGCLLPRKDSLLTIPVVWINADF